MSDEPQSAQASALTVSRAVGVFCSSPVQPRRRRRNHPLTRQLLCRPVRSPVYPGQARACMPQAASSLSPHQSCAGGGFLSGPNDVGKEGEVAAPARLSAAICSENRITDRFLWCLLGASNHTVITAADLAWF